MRAPSRARTTLVLATTAVIGLAACGGDDDAETTNGPVEIESAGDESGRIQLPGTAVGYWTLTAGLAEASGVEGVEAFVVTQAVFVVAAAFAVLGILRRRTWGTVLGIGLAVAVVVWRVLVMLAVVQQVGQSMDGGTYLSTVANLIGMGAIPALAGAVLLGLPLLRRPARPVDASGAGWHPESAATDPPN